MGVEARQGKIARDLRHVKFFFVPLLKTFVMTPDYQIWTQFSPICLWRMNEDPPHATRGFQL